MQPAVLTWLGPCRRSLSIRCCVNRVTTHHQRYASGRLAATLPVAQMRFVTHSAINRCSATEPAHSAGERTLKYALMDLKLSGQHQRRENRKGGCASVELWRASMQAKTLQRSKLKITIRVAAGKKSWGVSLGLTSLER